MIKKLFIFALMGVFLPIQVFALVPNDPHAVQWSYEDTGVYEAWDVTTGDSSVVVAVIDSGFDTFHPDLKDNAWKNIHEIPKNGIDDDQNGYIDDVWGWNFVPTDIDEDGEFSEEELKGNNNPRPEVQKDVVLSEMEGGALHHGTLVAGIIGAKGNNKIAGAGINWDVSLMNLRALDDYGMGDNEIIDRAIRYAVDNGADIINLSLVGSFTTEESIDAIKYAYEKGVVVVAAAGNYAINMNVFPQYPVCADTPLEGEEKETFILGVSAMDEEHYLALFSNGGSDCIDLTAPGVAISSTLRFHPAYGLDEHYGGPWNGTSFAAPFVSGAAALIKSLQPEWGPDEIYAAILDNVHKTPPDDEEVYANLYGSGLLQIDKAVKFAALTAVRNSLAGIHEWETGAKNWDSFRFSNGEKQSFELDSVPDLDEETRIYKNVAYNASDAGINTLITKFDLSSGKSLTPLFVSARNISDWKVGNFDSNPGTEVAVLYGKQGKKELSIFSEKGKKLKTASFDGTADMEMFIEGNNILLYNYSFEKGNIAVKLWNESFELLSEMNFEGFENVYNATLANVDSDASFEFVFAAKRNGRDQLYFGDDTGALRRYFTPYDGVKLDHMKVLSSNGNIITYFEGSELPLRVWNTKGRKQFEMKKAKTSILIPFYK